MRRRMRRMRRRGTTIPIAIRAPLEAPETQIIN